MKVAWGKTRKLRSVEIVMGLLHEVADLHPMSAMVWNTISNARRLMLKDSKIEEQAVRILKLREARIDKEYNEHKEHQDGVEASNGRDSGSSSQDLSAATGRPGNAAEAHSSSGVGVELDPSRPFGVGFALSCERNPTATNLTEGSSALPAWQRPPRARVECTACAAMASCTGVMTNEREEWPRQAEHEQARSSTPHNRSAQALGALGAITAEDHHGPRGVYRPVTNIGILSKQHCGPSPGCTEKGGDCGSAGSHDPGASNGRTGSKSPGCPACIPDLQPFSSTPQLAAGAVEGEERLKKWLCEKRPKQQKPAIRKPHHPRWRHREQSQHGRDSSMSRAQLGLWLIKLKPQDSRSLSTSMTQSSSDVKDELQYL